MSCELIINYFTLDNKYIAMNDKIPMRMIVRNSRSNPMSRDSSLELPLIQDNSPNTNNYKSIESNDLKERLLKLEGNLKILEKKYKQNLKEGFQHKIKAYRLQAVIQRKLLKQALIQTSQTIEKEALNEKFQKTIQYKQMQNERINIINQKKAQRANYLKAKMQSEKQSISLSLYESRKMSERINREMHDRIIEEEGHVDRKRKYYEYIRKMSIKRDQNIMKRDYLEKISKNTQLLKDLKRDLQQIRETNQTDIPNPFLTI